ncbi:MAG: TlpA family protein disulfide reductase [Chitinophagales bacterium]
MKSFLFLFVFLPVTYISAQKPSAIELYQKIENYYLQNPVTVEYVDHVHRNALGYDTLYNSFAYISCPEGSFLLASIGPEYTVMNGLLVSDNNYLLDAEHTEKTKLKNNELKGTIYPNLDYLPSYHSNSLEKTFGSIKSFNKVKDQYQVLTSKYILKVDTLSFRINSLTRLDMFEGRVQYDLYKYLSLSDSTQALLKQQAWELVEVSKGFSITTIKEEEKNRIRVTGFEGQLFSFNNLVSFNKGPLDSAMKDKYVILDFFYQTCYPCHKMTGWILDWLPSVDSSRIILIGVDEIDSEKSMWLFTKDKKINYPIIIGQQAKDIFRHYYIDSAPTLFLLSPDGKIQTIHEGMSKNFLTKAEKIVSR